MQRREFFGSLATLPLVFMNEPRMLLSARYELPVEIDLSLAGLEWALLIGHEKDLGKPLFLSVGPELKFIARELIGTLAIQPEGIKLTVADNLVRDHWMVIFERGTVGSGI